MLKYMIYSHVFSLVGLVSMLEMATQTLKHVALVGSSHFGEVTYLHCIP